MGNKTIGDLRTPAKFGRKEGVQPGEFKEGVLYRSLGGQGFHKLGRKWHMQQETVHEVKHRELPHTDESLHRAHGPLYASGTPTQEGPKGGKFASSGNEGGRRGHPTGSPGHHSEMAAAVHHTAAQHLEYALESHREAAHHLGMGDHKAAKAAWGRAKGHLEAAKYSHKELGRHHSMFKDLEGKLGAMFTECTRPDCYGTHEGRPEPVTLDKGMKCPKCKTQYPKDWQGHGDKRALNFPHKGVKEDFKAKFADADSKPDPEHHAALVKHGWHHVGMSKLEHNTHVYQGHAGVAFHTPGKGTHVVGGIQGWEGTTHDTAKDLHEHLGKLNQETEYHKKRFKVTGPEPSSAGRLRAVSDLGAKFGSLSDNHAKVLKEHGYEYGYSHGGKNIWTHPSGHTAHTDHEGTAIYKGGKKLNTMSHSGDLHEYLAYKHGAAKHSDEPELGAMFAEHYHDHHEVLAKYGYKKTKSSSDGYLGMSKTQYQHKSGLRVTVTSGAPGVHSYIAWHPSNAMNKHLNSHEALAKHLEKVHGAKK